MRYIPYGWHTIDEDDINAVTRTLRSNWITQGPKIRDFEEALCRYATVKYAVAVSSGTSALHIACLAAGINKGDEAITSPITFLASANCILYCSAKPVFADIQEDTINMNPEEIKKKITSKTKAIIPVHFAGHPCDLKEIQDIAKKHNLLVIEDAAHALGAQYRDTKVGSCKYSDMTIFSFHPVKHLTTGEGGAVLTNRKDLYEKLLMLRNHGITKENSRFKTKGSRLNKGKWYYEMQYLGFNYRITDFQCALGNSQLKKIRGFLKRRRQIASVYSKELSQIKEIILPLERPYAKSSWHIYYIRLRDTRKRRVIFDRLQRFGIGVQVHYIPVYWQAYYQDLGYNKGLCPKAEQYYRQTITLPLYPKMQNTDINYVTNYLKKAL